MGYCISSSRCPGHLVQYHLCTKQKMKFSSVNMPKSTGNTDLVTSTEEILNGKLYFLCEELEEVAYLRGHFIKGSLSCSKLHLRGVLV